MSVANWIEIGYALLNVIVAVTPHGASRRWAAPIRSVLDVAGRLAVVTHPDAPGTLKLPGQRAGGPKAWVEAPPLETP